MPKADIEALKAAHPILDVLRDLGLEARNQRFRCPRPENHVHGDRTPSVSVWPERGQFKCWVCPDVKGDVIDLVRLVKGCTFREAIAFLGGAPAGAAPPPRSPRTSVSAPSRGPVPSGNAAPEPAVSAATPTQVPPDEEVLRLKILAAFLDLCPPVGGKSARYLQRRRIFRRTWEAQGLRMVDDYGGLSDRLAGAFGLPALERSGFFNAAGHLRYYRHRLLFPYFDRAGRPVYMQARALEEEVKPKELSLPGHIPLPYNCRLLDGEPGQVYLCEGVIDTLTLIEQGFPAVGIPGAANFKGAWAELFRGKTVHVAFDPDIAGDAGAAKAMDLFRAAGVEARRLAPPRGMDLNDWFRKG